MTPQAQITPNTFYAPPTSQSQSQSNPPITIFFITGNPGLIGYYHSFLSLLSETLSSQPQKPGSQNPDEIGDDDRCGPGRQPGFQIYGRSLGGFDLPDSTSTSTSVSDSGSGSGSGPGSEGNGKCFDLEDQICFVQRDLDRFMADQGGVGSGTGRRKVILIGHSVGSYIAMEILRRHRDQRQTQTEAEVKVDSEFDILGGIMLFPTVIDIAKSISGQKLVRLLSFIPHLAILASTLASLFTFLLPDSILRWIVGTVMGWPPVEVVDTTLGFLRCRGSGGVRQAIHMGADEMKTITTDKWTDDIWGIGSDHDHGAGGVPRLYFYFGKNDHWVAEQTRDEIIALRGGGGSRTGTGTGIGPKMLVCEDDVPHAFCLRHSGVMAKKVGAMVWGTVGGTERVMSILYDRNRPYA